MKVSSPQFPNEGLIPDKCTCDGDNRSPTLLIDDIPPEAKSMALIVDDPDSPRGDFVHWISYDIPPTERIEQGDHPGKEGINDFGNRRYDGPCPNAGTHNYRFQVYALDQPLNLPQGQKIADIQHAMIGHVLDSGLLLGRYSR